MQQLIDTVTALSSPLAGTPTWAWLLFLAIVVGLLALDLGVFHREDKPISLKESLWTSALYIVAALAFAGWVSRRERKKVEMLFAHLKRIVKLDRLRLRGRMERKTSSSSPPPPRTSGSSPS